MVTWNVRTMLILGKMQAIGNEMMKRRGYCEIYKTPMIRWLEHVKRMEVGAMPRKMMEGRLFT
jgi:hypothetical protein